jgi:carbonic anhydrase
MTKVLNEVLAANARYADDFGERSELPMRPGRRFAILTCMDARLDPAKFAGLAEGDAHVIRNAGGRASDDAIRSLVISYTLLGWPAASRPRRSTNGVGAIPAAARARAKRATSTG